MRNNGWGENEYPSLQAALSSAPVGQPDGGSFQFDFSRNQWGDVMELVPRMGFPPGAHVVVIMSRDDIFSTTPAAMVDHRLLSEEDAARLTADLNAGARSGRTV